MKAFVVAILLLFSQNLFAQSNKELALQKGQEALRLEDEEGKYDEALKLLEEAHKLDPEKITYEYEMAYTWSAKKEYTKAVTILERLLKHKDVHDRVYQMLGNSYDFLKQPERAIKTYEDGLKKFPNSGPLYLERGNMHWIKEEYNDALKYYEKGIEMDPAFPSNYYRATRLNCASDEAVWGMIYGEIFMNLERNSARTAEISKLLFNTYDKNIHFNGDSTRITFCKDAVLRATDGDKIKMPFGNFCYELNLMVPVAMEKKIDIESIDRIRTFFVSQYFKGNCAKDYPNVLFDYQKKIKDAGHFSAYNHWLMMKGDEELFEKWFATHKEAYESFAKWYTANPLRLDADHKFYSGNF